MGILRGPVSPKNITPFRSNISWGKKISFNDPANTLLLEPLITFQAPKKLILIWSRNTFLITGNQLTTKATYNEHQIPINYEQKTNYANCYMTPIQFHTIVIKAYDLLPCQFNKCHFKMSKYWVLNWNYLPIPVVPLGKEYIYQIHMSE